MKGEAGHFVGHDEPTVLGKADHMEEPYRTESMRPPRYSGMSRARVEVANSFQAPTKDLSVRIIRSRVPILMRAHGAKEVVDSIVLPKAVLHNSEFPPVHRCRAKESQCIKGVSEKV